MQVLTSIELKEKINNGEKFIVDMYADWCGPCRILGPIVEKVGQKLVEEGSEVSVYKFDIETDKDLALELGVRSIPTIKAFKDGKLVDKIIGALPKPMLKTKLETYI